jgi:hypothetical protein
VKNLATGRVVPGMINEREFGGFYNLFKLDHLDAGEYEITAWFKKRHPMEIDLFKGKSEFSHFFALNSVHGHFTSA